MNTTNEYSRLEQLVQAHRQHTGIVRTKKITFLGVEGNDVYNISQAFTWEGKHYIAGRVEARTTENSHVRIFERITEDVYQSTPIQIPMFQDPCVEVIDGELVIGGTAIFPDEQGHITSWRTTFYKGKDLHHLTKVIEAPLKMKDVRLIKTDQYYVFSRPQGGVAGFGKIGFAATNRFDHISTELIQNAPLIEDFFGARCWGGVNQVHALKNGWLGVLGHIARMTEGDVRHYYGIAFAIHPKTRQITPVKVICERADFAFGAAKRPDLVDVVFVGGLNRNPDGTATLYTGLSDAEAHFAIIDDPFIEFERG